MQENPSFYTSGRREALAAELAQHPPATLYDWLARRAADADTAFETFLKPGRYRQVAPLSYARWWDQVSRIANLLRSLGIGEGDVVTLWAPNLPATAAALVAGLTAGQVLLLAPRTPPEAAVARMAELGSRLLITTAPFPGMNLWTAVEAVRPELPALRYILQIDPAAYLGRWGRWQAHMAMRRLGKAEPVPGQQLGDLLRTAAHQPEALTFSPVGGERPALHGLAGEPLSHAALLQRARGLAAALPPPGLVPWTAPLSSAAEVLTCLLWPLGAGGRVLVCGPAGLEAAPTRQALGAWAAHYAPAWLPLPASLLLEGLAGGWTAADLPPACHVLGWGPAVAPAAWATVTAQLGREPWALPADLAGVGAIQPPGAPPVALPGIEPQPLRPPVFLHQGHPVEPAAVEAVLAQHPAVWEVAVAGRREAGAGAVPVAFVRLAPGQEVAPQALYDFAQEHLPVAEMVPRGIRLVTALPRTWRGEPDRLALRTAEEAARAQAEA